MSPVVLIGILIAIALLLFFLVRPDYEIVPEEERLVIYRLGRFNRIAGPGMVWLSRNTETVQRRYSVRNEPQDSFVDGLMVYGVPVGLTLNIWWGYDPQKSATQGKAKLAELAFFTEAERRGHLAVKLRDSLVRQINVLEQKAPLGSAATVVDKIMPILPGMPTCTEVLKKVQQELAESLTVLGIYLDTSQPIVMTRLYPPEDLIKGFSRDRVADLLKMRFPGLPDSIMVHMLEAIEGLDPLRIHEIRQVGNAGMATEARWADTDTLFRVPLTGGSTSPQEKAPLSTGSADDQAKPTTTHLSHSDLALLKRVPRESTGRRRAA